MIFRFHVSGERACFARPEFVRDRISYDVITPFAARALIDAIYRPPSIRWRVDAIHVLHPIRMEMLEGDPARKQLDLMDVAYLIEARFELTSRASADDHLAQHASLVRRRALRQTPFRPPFLGIESYPARYRLLADEEASPVSALAGSTMDLGWMVHDLDGQSPSMLRFFRPVMVDGIIRTSGDWIAGLPI